MASDDLLLDIELRKARLPQFLSLESRCFFWGWLAGLPAMVMAIIMLVESSLAFPAKWAMGLGALVVWFGFAGRIWVEIARQLLVVSSVLRSFVDGDFAPRLTPSGRQDLLSDVIDSVNTLGSTLRNQRLGATEMSLLLRSVTDEIDVAVFAFDSSMRLSLVNRAGEKALDRPRSVILHQHAKDLGMQDLLDVGQTKIVTELFRQPGTRWEVKRKVFYEDGQPHTLLLLTDLTIPLRQEERSAWQRLISVLGHELNNSLTPMQSLSASLIELLDDPQRPEDWEADARQSLELIVSRSASLRRFLSGYAKLANLPPARKTRTRMLDLLQRVVSLEHRVPIKLHGEARVVLWVDRDQIEHALINIIKNAADATSEIGGRIDIVWRVSSDCFEIAVRDEGPGIGASQNLFVPLFTTKTGGSGIGLVLSRQIVEGHGGTLTLRNRNDRSGCEALVQLPLD